MKLLIDTCTFLWLASGEDRIGTAALAAYLDPENERYLSAASAWEIAIKHALGRLPLPAPPGVYIPGIRQASGVETLAISEEAALHVSRLPDLHSDPFDRMIVAQAIVHGMTILTPDDAVGQYAARVLW